MNDSEVTRALAELGSSGVGTHLRPQLEALISKIPVAGTNLAAAMKHHRDQRRLEKILAVLEHLNEKTQGQDEALKSRLTEDQANELIHESLNAAAIASEKEKLRMLKHGLANAFTSDRLEFARKQMYLQIARELSVCECALLEEIYSKDPHVKKIFPPPDEHSAYLGTSMLVMSRALYTHQVSYCREGSAPTLRETLRSRFEKWPDGLFAGIGGRLDAKGLSNLVDNLNSNEFVKVYEEMPSNPAGLLTLPRRDTLDFAGAIPLHASTPTERSRTDMGLEFLEFVRSS